MVLVDALLRGAGSLAATSLQVTTRDVPRSDPPQQLVKLTAILTLIFGSISVISTLSTLYWFVKMRRSFRHELIMLLIQSDFVKSSAFVIFPVVTLVRGNVESSSAFCQVSGFALAVGIESADIAVLLIAVHSVMYIFRPRSGLYPYRRTAYLIYYLFPLAVASLAFVDGTGYQNVGHYCYLRTDNGWARMALSWVPRYIIGTSIAMIYAFVYFYVRKRMGDYGRRSSTNIDGPPAAAYRDSEVPPTPPIAYHGLLSSAPCSRRGSAADSVAKGHHRSSFSSIRSIRLENPHGHGNDLGGVEQGIRASSRPTKPIRWNTNWSGFDKNSTLPKPAVLPEDDHADPLSKARLSIYSPPPVHSPEDHHRQSISEDPFDEFLGPHAPPSARRPLAASYPAGRRESFSKGAEDAQGVGQRRSRNMSLPSFAPIGRKSSSVSAGNRPDKRISVTSTEHTATTTTTTTSTSTLTNPKLPPIALPMPPLLPPPTETSPILIPGETFWDDYPGPAKNREKIRRQLLSLIVYPLAYLVIWAFPFVSHVMGYDDSVNPSEPLWLLVVGVISLCIQGSVDSLLFAVREKPWRYARGRFWDSLGKRMASSVNFWARDGAGWRWKWRGATGAYTMAGRTREEMLVDGRLARQRRDQEVASERARRAGKAGGGGSMGTGTGLRRWSRNQNQNTNAREWWDVVEGDGAWTSDEESGDDDDGNSAGGREEVSQHLG